MPNNKSEATPAEYKRRNYDFKITAEKIKNCNGIKFILPQKKIAIKKNYVLKPLRVSLIRTYRQLHTETKKSVETILDETYDNIILELLIAKNNFQLKSSLITYENLMVLKQIIYFINYFELVPFSNVDFLYLAKLTKDICLTSNIDASINNYLATEKEYRILFKNKIKSRFIVEYKYKTCPSINTNNLSMNMKHLLSEFVYIEENMKNILFANENRGKRSNPEYHLNIIQKLRKQSIKALIKLHDNLEKENIHYKEIDLQPFHNIIEYLTKIGLIVNSKSEVIEAQLKLIENTSKINSKIYDLANLETKESISQDTQFFESKEEQLKKFEEASNLQEIFSKKISKSKLKTYHPEAIELFLWGSVILIKSLEFVYITERKDSKPQGARLRALNTLKKEKNLKISSQKFFSQLTLFFEVHKINNFKYKHIFIDIITGLVKIDLLSNSQINKLFPNATTAEHKICLFQSPNTQLKIGKPFEKQNNLLREENQNLGNLILKGGEKEIEEALAIVKNSPTLLSYEVEAIDPLGRRVRGTLLQIAAMGGDVDLIPYITDSSQRGAVEKLAAAGNLFKQEIIDQLKCVTSDEALRANEVRNKRILAAIKKFGNAITEVKTDGVYNLKEIQAHYKPYIDKLDKDLTPDTESVTTSGYIFDPTILQKTSEWYEENHQKFGCFFSHQSKIFLINGFGKLQAKLSARDAMSFNSGIVNLFHYKKVPKRSLQNSDGNSYFYNPDSNLGASIFLSNKGEASTGKQSRAIGWAGGYYIENFILNKNYSLLELIQPIDNYSHKKHCILSNS